MRADEFGSPVRGPAQATNDSPDFCPSYIFGLYSQPENRPGKDSRFGQRIEHALAAGVGDGGACPLSVSPFGESTARYGVWIGLRLCAEIAELRRSPRFPFRVVGTRTLFSAPQARTLPGDLMISACSAQKAVVTRPRTFAITSSLDGRNRSNGTEKSVFCSEVERGRMRNAVRGHVCDHNRASSLMAGRVALPIRWADPLGRSVGPIRWSAHQSPLSGPIPTEASLRSGESAHENKRRWENPAALSIGLYPPANHDSRSGCRTSIFTTGRGGRLSAVRRKEWSLSSISGPSSIG
jgi:hypothetical protein